MALERCGMHRKINLMHLEPGGGRFRSADAQGGTMYDKARDTVTGTAAKVQQGAYDLKDRAMGTGSAAPTGSAGYTQVTFSALTVC